MKKIWKKSLAFGLSLFMTLESPLSFLGLTKITFGAEQPASVKATSLNVRSGPGMGYSIVGKLDYGTQVMVISEAAASDQSVWYQIRFTGNGGASAIGYVLSAYITFPSVYSTDADFENYLNAQGFPESYRPGLRELHSRYPQWIFTAFDTGLDWNEVIQNESLVGRNLVSSQRPSSWKSKADGAYDWASNTWPGFDGSDWVAASEDIIRYYMDPRNFLNETYIFQFLGQSYDPSIHTREGLTALVKGTFLEGAVSVGDTWKGGSTSQGTGGSGPVGENNQNQNAGNVTPPVQTEGGGVSTSPPGGGSGGSEYGPGYGSPSGGVPSNVQVGVPPGANISKAEPELSISPNKVQRVAATVIRVGPGEQTNPSQGSLPEETSAGSANPGIASGNSNTPYTGGAVPYVDILMEAGVQSGVNPYVLAAMILQEQGSQGKSESISGANGYYNFFNFEAYASNGMTAVQRGLWYASQPGDYMRPWNSVDKAIIGGACQYGQTYVKAGQNTFYLKKFNVQGSNLYKHQYMTNIEGAASEGAKMAGAYSQSMRQTPMQFVIPIYRNMPVENCPKPSLDGSPNNKLSAISIDGFSLTPAFSQDISFYEAVVDPSVTSVMLRATAVDSTAQISGTGTINLTGAVTDIKIMVTAQDGTVREYTIRISQKGGSSQTQGTGTGNTNNGPGYGTPDGGGGIQNGPGGSNVTIVN
ncbi:MAG: SH3 domain-containing protein [Lachnospiraceae bacterium]|jgi:beta-N-acetylglucosaminidase|nr:SH3 domain-containing protein [Lachnospiraceae bacterium]